ncbi:hypothetical protein Bca4012_022878 [Brassica carinata]
MQIRDPTDVKHVAQCAHIGWDGPSDNATSPSWDESSVKCQSEYGGLSRDPPKITKKSASEKGSPTKEKSDKDQTSEQRHENKGDYFKTGRRLLLVSTECWIIITSDPKEKEN